MDSLVFKVEGLECSYNKRDVVLRIASLTIPYNQVIFIVGPSGIGKSTFLETLGLMNDTVSNPDQAKIEFITSDGKVEEFSKMWTSPDKVLSSLRSRHFSFIFQDTNLMPGLTAGQNLCTKLLIQGKTLSEAKELALPFMARLDLHSEFFERKVFELSGGQRQRLAFLRAFLGEYNVLFGDEPTGNLDEQTSGKLMSMLCESIRSQPKASAVIVSHDLRLASLYADMIIPILPQVDPIDSERKSGLIHMESVLVRTGAEWARTNGQLVEDLESHLRLMLAGNSVETIS